MPTYTLRPTGDTKAELEERPAGSAFARLDDTATDPTAPPTSVGDDISFIGAGTQYVTPNSAANNMTATGGSMPTHASGDLLLMFVFYATGTTTNGTISTPSGWSDFSADFGAAANSLMGKIFYKVAASGSETFTSPAFGNPTTGTGTSAGVGIVQVHSYRNVDTSSMPASAKSGFQATNSGAGTATSIGALTGLTPSLDRSMIVVGGSRSEAATGNANVLTGDSLTWTERLDATTTNAGDAAAVIDTSTVQTTAAAIANKTITYATAPAAAKWQGFVLALAPGDYDYVASSTDNQITEQSYDTFTLGTGERVTSVRLKVYAKTYSANHTFEMRVGDNADLLDTVTTSTGAKQWYTITHTPATEGAFTQARIDGLRHWIKYGEPASPGEANFAKLYETYIEVDTVFDKAGSETFTLSDSAAKEEQTEDIQKSGSDSAAVGDTSSPQANADRSDALTLSEAVALANTLSAADSAALSEGVVQLGLSVTDALTLAEAVSLANALSASDSATLSEGIPQIGHDRTDALTLGEIAALANALAASDSGVLTEGTPEIGQSRTDNFTLSDAVSLANTLAASDAGTLTEVAALTRMFTATDSAAFTDAAQVLEVVLVAVSDSLTMSEALTLSQLFSVSDSAALNEALTLSQLFSVTDAAALADVAALTRMFTATDSATLSEAADLTAVAMIAGSDDLTLSEAYTLSSLFSVADSAALSEALALANTLAALDSATLTDAASVSSDILVNVSDAFALAEALTLARQSSVIDSATAGETYTLDALLSRVDSAAFMDVNSGIGLSRTDSFGLTEALILSTTLALTDNAVLSESATNGQETLKSASESFALSDTASLAIQAFKVVSDTLTLTEAVSTAIALAAADSGVVSDAVALNATVLRTDGLTLGEVTESVLSFARVDAGTLSDAAALTQAREALDSLTLSDIAALSTALQRVDDAALAEVIDVSSQILKQDAFSLATEFGSVNTNERVRILAVAVTLAAKMVAVGSVDLSHTVVVVPLPESPEGDLSPMAEGSGSMEAKI